MGLCTMKRDSVNNMSVCVCVCACIHLVLTCMAEVPVTSGAAYHCQRANTMQHPEEPKIEGCLVCQWSCCQAGVSVVRLVCQWSGCQAGVSVVMLSGWCVWSCCKAGVSVVMLSGWCVSGQAGVSVFMLSGWCVSVHAVRLVCQ